jgi:hypothetical protein
MMPRNHIDNYFMGRFRTMIDRQIQEKKAMVRNQFMRPNLFV